jgi:very-short-patch-repair endonuclease
VPPLRSLSLSRARDLRKNATDAETVLWRRLRRRGLDGFKFRRQEPVGAYIVDFLCSEARLVVELDGGGHDAEDQRRYDVRRTDVLEQFGLRVLRFWNNDVHRNIEEVLLTILEAARTPSP